MRERQASTRGVGAPSRIFSKNCRGGIARDNGNGNDAAACGFHFFAAYDLIACPVAAFNQNVRKQSRDHLARRELIENHHSIHAFERGENFGTLTFRPVRGVRRLSTGARWHHY